MNAQGILRRYSVTVSQRNLHALPELIAYLFQHDLPFSLSYYRENSCSVHTFDLQFSNEQMIHGMLAAFDYIEEHLPERGLLNSLIDKASMSTQNQHVCDMGRNYLVIDQHGQVAKCNANITQTVTTIEADDPLQVIRADRTSVQAIPVDQKEGCNTCQWRYWCRGGCPMLTYRMTGRSDLRSPNCDIYKALFPAALRLEALRLLKYEPPLTL